jgi:hypothetical protein
MTKTVSTPHEHDSHGSLPGEPSGSAQPCAGHISWEVLA